VWDRLMRFSLAFSKVLVSSGLYGRVQAAGLAVLFPPSADACSFFCLVKFLLILFFDIQTT